MFDRRSLVVRNLRYHARGSLAVLLGTAVGAAVLCGALLVGDSLRGSLRERAAEQLSGANQLLVGTRFVRESIAPAIGDEVQPVLLLRGGVSTQNRGGAGRLNQATILGTTGWPVGDSPLLTGDAPVAIVSASVARGLSLQVGDTLKLSIQKASAIPRSSVLGRRTTEDATRTLTVTVRQILDEHAPGDLFTLTPGPQAPANVFVPLKYLQKLLDQPGRVNAFIHTGSERTTDELNSRLAAQLTLEDWGLTLEAHGRGVNEYLALESKQLLLEPQVVEAARRAADGLCVRSASTLVYLVNRITPGAGERPQANSLSLLLGGAARLGEIPYSIVAAVDPGLPAPLGPFTTEPGRPLRDDEIILVDWSAPTLLGSQPGQRVSLNYFKPEIEGRIEEATSSFRLRELIPLQGAVADPGLTPPFPGITDRRSLTTGGVDGWDPPFPYDSTRVGPRDELFWNRHRTTPKAFITLAAGQKLWGSRFGEVTSLRIAPRPSQTVGELQQEFRERLLQQLEPAKGGLQFDPIRERLEQAGKGSTDFGLLFLAFSFFLIAAALMLVGLLFRLNLDRRARELGLLLATGYTTRQVRGMLLKEGLILASLGSLLGLAAAALYARGMIELLTTLWPTPGVESFLKLHVTPLSLVIGFVGAVLMSWLSIRWAVRILQRLSPRALLAGQAQLEQDRSPQSNRTRYLAICLLIAAVGLLFLAPALPAGEAQAGGFFGSGVLLLSAVLIFLWRRLTARSVETGISSVAALGVRNAYRNPTRSLLTAGLLAFAAFLLVAVESFRRQPERDFAQKDGGSGGFAWIAESEVPIFIDLDNPADRQEILEQIERAEQNKPTPFAERRDNIEAQLTRLQWLRLRRQAGEDASCLNLYQATRPRILGVPDRLIERGGFQFVATRERRENPWTLLNDPIGEGQPIPLFVEQNTAMWMLKKGLGDTLELPDASGNLRQFRIDGLLKDSVFQSEVIISDAAFRRCFPRQEGFNVFLADFGDADAAELGDLITEGFSRYGLSLQPSRERLASYLAVVNTYLSTFQLLGGFGLLLGVLGLAIVLLRSIWERRAELALFRAVGYPPGSLRRLVLAENLALMFTGLASGVLCATLAILPHVAQGGSIPWLRLGITLLTVLLVGTLTILLTVRRTAQAAIVPALRRE